MIFAQIRAVIRMEMRKTFFARRGLWVYLLAFAPALLLLVHSLNELRDRDHRRELAGAHPVSREALTSIKPGATIDETVAQAGQPYSQRTFQRRFRSTTIFSYTDGISDFTFIFAGDRLMSVSTRDVPNLQQETVRYAGMFQFFYLRLAVFFGCAGIFMNLFRGEMLDKSLHFYLLAPIRREVLLIGKYLAGLIATVVIFTTSTALQIWAMLWEFDHAAVSEYLNGPGWGHIGAYLGVTALACLGYGSLFLAAGLLARNPIIPAAGVLMWESINPFLSAALKKVSVIFYLQSLCPVVAPPSSDMGPLALLLTSAEPTPAVWAISGLIVVTVAVLAFAAIRARRLEINYGTD